jgi:hypothetical protein
MWNKFESAARIYHATYHALETASNKRCAETSPSSVEGEEVVTIPKVSRTHVIAPNSRVSQAACIEQNNLLPQPPETVMIGSYSVNAIGIGTLPLGVQYSGGGRPTRDEVM